MTRKCNMKICRGEALRSGRLIAELSTKSMETPIHRIFDEDLQNLRDRLNNLINYCSLTDEDKRKINDIYVTLSASQIMKGKKIAGDLAELMNILYYSNDECDCERRK